jgi:hypothetical protein
MPKNMSIDSHPKSSSTIVNNSLRREACTLTMLLTLVTGLNHGHPTLVKPFRERYQGTFEKPLSNRLITLNAIAIILVRNFEVIAAAVHDSESQPLLIQAQSAKKPFDVIIIVT